MNKYEYKKDYILTTILKDGINICLREGFKPMILPSICRRETYKNLALQSNLRLFEVSYNGKNYGFLRPEGTKLHLLSLDQTTPEEQRFFY